MQPIHANIMFLEHKGAFSYKNQHLKTAFSYKIRLQKGAFSYNFRSKKGAFSEKPLSEQGIHKSFDKNSSLVTTAYKTLEYNALQCDELYFQLITPKSPSQGCD